MAIPNNRLQNVQTYQKAELAWMLNEFVAVSTANKKFKDFNNINANPKTAHSMFIRRSH